MRNSQASKRVPGTKPSRPDSARTQAACKQEAHVAASAGKPSILSLLKQRNVWGIAIPRLLADPTWGTLSFWIPIYLMKERGFDLTLIETMPMGEIGADRTEQYLPLSLVRARLAQHFTLDDIAYRSGGPARAAIRF